jgi:predicted nucleotidyltransferase
MLTETDHKIAERLKAMMIKRGLPIEEVIVFGSRARGDFEEDSDLDVLVVVTSASTLQVTDAIRNCAWEVGVNADRYVQSVILSRDEVENTPFRASLFMQTIREEGVRI